MSTDAKKMKLITENRRARFEYHITRRLETGIVLTGTEVKSIRQGHFSLGEAYVAVRDGELFLIGAHIRPYEQGNRFNPDPTRDRKLLAHKHEIRQLDVATQQRGMTLVPLKAYFVDGRVKIEIGVARGKKLYDKRETIKERSQERDIRQRMKETSRE
ncbi:MAG: SsrA-binding protein SmpB [Clostridiaceae bacterium]|jgi:SsrA-binding protein|nr:SsrA-binding protein SmpB [Clostridia bacterium]MBP6162212.1 SsrA-binding protein SmpB [Clostridia bacterium]MBP6950468.1 SsrA-binding protein SmpB [Clostridia bacterium]NMA36537.1 SsrA-binding protein SmpB [Clostridiaceae bacterium]